MTTNPYPVDSTTRPCCGAIGGHSRTCEVRRAAEEELNGLLGDEELPPGLKWTEAAIEQTNAAKAGAAPSEGNRCHDDRLSKVPLPDGAEIGSDFPDWGGYCRILFGQRRDVPSTTTRHDSASVHPAVTQLPDGALADAVVHVDTLNHDGRYRYGDALTLDAETARGLAAALLAAADQVDGWIAK